MFLRDFYRLSQEGAEIMGFFVFYGKTLLKKPLYPLEIHGRFIKMFLSAIPLITCISLFTGIVLALQSYGGFPAFKQQIPKIVALSFARELSPVLCGLMMAGHWGAALTAQVSSMRQGDQWDALKVFSINPINYICTPWILSGTLLLPLLTFFSTIVGIMGGYLLSILGKPAMLSSQYLYVTAQNLQFSDFLFGGVKSLFFGFFLTLFGAFFGHKEPNVGKATTKGVVAGCLSILTLNTIITLLWI